MLVFELSVCGNGSVALVGVSFNWQAEEGYNGIVAACLCLCFVCFIFLFQLHFLLFSAEAKTNLYFPFFLSKQRSKLSSTLEINIGFRLSRIS